MTGAPGVNASLASVDAFVSLTVQNIFGCPADLKNLTEAIVAPGSHVQYDACQLLNCPRGNELTAAVVETTDVLERTKSSFKSKELGALRKKLETLVKDVPKGSGS